MIIKIHAIIFATLFICTNSLAERYDIKDLEQLSDTKNYEEFLNHARDIRPSKRDKYWKSLVDQMAIGQIDFLIEKKLFNKDQFDLIERISLWPELNKDNFFQNKRNRYAEKYLKSCFEKNAKDCKSQLFTFWHSSNQRAELAMKMVEYLKLYTDHKEYWNFYQKITKSDLQEYYCPQPHVKKVIFKHMQMNLMEIEDKATINRFIKANIGVSCWFLLVDDFKGLLFSKGPTLREFAYRILDAEEALTPVERDSFHAFYLLDNPINGDLFNRAWSTVSALGQDFGRRMKVRKKLTSIDPLPGNIFAHRDELKKEAVIELFHSNFPEYVDHYAKLCVNFLKGVGSYPKGTPTLYCNELFKVSKKKRWVSQSLKVQYSSLKK
jgi:hypothetical protein